MDLHLSQGPSPLEAHGQAFVVANSTPSRVTQGYSIRFMRVISDAKSLECRVHMYVYDGVHDRC